MSVRRYGSGWWEAHNRDGNLSSEPRRSEGWAWSPVHQAFVVHESDVGHATAVAGVAAMKARLQGAGGSCGVLGGDLARPPADSATRAGLSLWVPAGDPEQGGEWVSVIATYTPGGDHLDVDAPGVYGAAVWPLLQEVGISHMADGRLSIEVHDDGGRLEDVEALVEGCPAGFGAVAAAALSATPGDAPVRARIGSDRVEIRRMGELVEVDLGELSALALDHMDDAEVATAVEGFGESPAVALARRGPTEVTDRELFAGFALMRSRGADVDNYAAARRYGATHAVAVEMFAGLSGGEIPGVVAEYRTSQESASTAEVPEAVETQPRWAADRWASQRGHRLVDASVLGAPPIYAMDEVPLAEVPVHAHFVSAAGDWWLTELDVDTGEGFGVARLADGAPELGYFSLGEFVEFKPGSGQSNGLPVGIERDLHWDQRPLGEIAALRDWGMLARDTTEMAPNEPVEATATAAPSTLGDVQVQTLMFDPATTTVGDVVSSGPAREGTTPAERRAVQVAAGDPDGLVDVADAAARVDSPVIADLVTRLSHSRSGVPPSGPKSRAKANIEVLEVLAAGAGRELTSGEQVALGAWSGWGACPAIFDESNEDWADLRESAQALMTDSEWDAARRTTLNAHYTDPRIAQAMTQLARAGLPADGGRVLEPGCGSGNFLDSNLWGEATSVVGVELDPTTAAVAARSHPGATVRAEGFEATNLPDGTFDAVVGNVPFGRYRLHDPSHNAGKHNIHNHFIIKSLDLAAPGGMVAVITSRFTMDAQNSAARREMHQLGDLVAAVRMPEGTHKDTAGTSVATDLLVFRRRAEGEARQEFTWEHATRRTDLLEGPVGDPEGVDAPMVNSLWSGSAETASSKVSPPHPAVRVVGTLGSGSGQYGQADLRVFPLGGAEGPAAEVAEAVRELEPVVDAWGFGTAEGRETIEDFRRPVGRAKEGSVDWDGQNFTVVKDGVVQPWKPRNRPEEVKRLIAVRDAALDVLEAQAATTSDVALEPLQRKLGQRYDAYVAKFGPLNRFKWSKPRTLKSGEVRSYRINPQMGGFRNDPDWPLLSSIEDYDDDTKVAKRAAIFTQRLLAPRPKRTSAESPGDALAICLDEFGRVDVDRVGELLGIGGGEAIEQLGEMVFFDPSASEWVERSDYLSGDVKTKLDRARLAAGDDPTLERNVAALTAVIPPDLQPDDIIVGFGAPWIDPEDYKAFLAEVVEVDVTIRHLPSQGEWVVKAPGFSRHNPLSTSVYGTKKRDAIDLAQTKMSGRPVTVRVQVGDGSGKTVVDPEATAAAQEAAEKLTERWEQWVWEDPARSARIAARYNKMFNRTVLRDFDGSHLTLEGLSSTISPHQHQLDAVWRVVSEPTVLLDHAVGSGKTGEMVMSAMELRRLGRVRQPWIVVPNHMLEQVSREMLEWYPGAKVLVADRAAMKDAATRKAFVARSAAGDWDAVVITHSMFERIPVSSEGMQAYVDDLKRPLLDDKSAAEEDGNDKTVKQIEAQLARLETSIDERAKTEEADNGLLWEQTGADYLFVDEAHLYKNLATSSKRRELAITGSNRATDLEMKLHSLRGRFGERVATFATGTPIANSVSEAQVMERFLRPDALSADGLRAFDSWVTNFAKTVQGLEMTPSGASWKVRERVARFCNVPELVTRFRAFADVVLSEDLNMPRPELSGGKHLTVVVDRSEVQAEIVAELEERAEKIAGGMVNPKDDNMLKVTGDGRLAALDPRAVGADAPENGGKVEAIADRVAATWAKHRNNHYTDDAGTPSHRQGGLQLVFCDRSTPQSDGSWSFYEQLRTDLYARGLPEGSVRFAQEANNDAAKAQLFADCRAGKVAVLIGSTEKMGIGTNVQKRLVALHHADCPWRPADLEQRDGRILRQGNENAEVDIVRYATEATFDVYMWQGCERKAGFISQLRQGGTAREMDDVGEQALSFAEVKALASGDPMVLEKAEVDGKLESLNRSLRAHNDGQGRLQKAVTDASDRVPRLEELLAAATEMAAQLVPTDGDAFKATFADGHVEGNRIDVGLRIQQAAKDAFDNPGNQPLMKLGGLDLYIEASSDGAEITTDHRMGRRVLYADDIARSDKALGIVRRCENMVEGIEDEPGYYQIEIDRLQAAASQADGQLGVPFSKQAEVEQLRVRQAEIAAHFEDAASTKDESAAPDEGSGFESSAKASLVAALDAGIRSRAGR